MNMGEAKEEKSIQAAGGLLWRKRGRSYEIAIVHRVRYDDWTLPKGKLQEGETFQQAALREVQEETGFRAKLQGFAGDMTYDTDKGPKVVRYWHMIAVEETNPPKEGEITEVVWVPIEKALSRLQYPLERALLETWEGPNKRR